MLKIFTFKFEEKHESFNDSMLTNFLGDKEIIRWESHFFERKNDFYWTVIVEYRSSVPSSYEPSTKTAKSKDESYKDLLTENDWPLYKVLREWRSERCKKDGVPPYIICTNLQLAKMAATRPTSLNSLGGIEGIGKAKLEKYGKEILQLIKSHGMPLTTKKEEDEKEKEEKEGKNE